MKKLTACMAVAAALAITAGATSEANAQASPDPQMQRLEWLVGHWVHRGETPQGGPILLRLPPPPREAREEQGRQAEQQGQLVGPTDHVDDTLQQDRMGGEEPARDQREPVSPANSQTIEIEQGRIAHVQQQVDEVGGP